MAVLRLLQVGVTVTVLGAPLCRGCSQDLAKGKPAYQSSTRASSVAILAVDGNYDDIWHQGSCTHTEHGQGNWWLVDLETKANVAGVTITNRGDCCNNRLVNFEVRVGYSFVGNSSFTQYRLCASYPGVAPKGNTSLSCAPLCRGCSQDLAKGKPAYQSSTRASSVAILAVDGNYNDIWHQGSCTHTDHGQGNWWLVDLETKANVAGVTVTNRGDCCNNRLVNFEVRVGYSFVGNSSFTQYKLCASYPGVAPKGNTSLTCRTPLRGRYVLIIKVGSDELALQLCEVEVHGTYMLKIFP
ncbi:fucolectin-like [Lingula anatina]|uniref:Fucolectin-like n=1 Tax=Lingula anatina TaxID=7574 RepID=A0A1S3KFZ0_LINAN|nr:fucolectin-like [Lingula anatina]|eukprot:XP_013421146.1 fucolectin-like [Lingula anatina]